MTRKTDTNNVSIDTNNAFLKENTCYKIKYEVQNL